tara:strand:- start:17026 stop:17451 length:426 start_codon:yes stop_codon:yes gene_type:complete
MHTNGYDTEEDEDIAREVLVGCIDIVDGVVFVEHRQPSDSIEDAVWSRASTLVMSSVSSMEEMYDMLSSHTMQHDVRNILEAGHVHRELEGSGLTFALECAVYLDEEGYRSGDLSFSLWIRTRPHSRLSTPASPVGHLRFD